MNTADSLNNSIDRHVENQPAGKVESHDLDSLSRRILAPPDVVEKLLGAGVLKSTGPIHGNDETGMHGFASDDLNEVRRAVLSAIVERTVEESDGEPDQITLAAGQALKNHAASFDKKPGEKREFSAFPKGLVQLARYGAPEDDPSLAEQAANTLGTIGKVAAVGAAGYSAAGWLRGRISRPGSIQLPGTQLPGAKGVLADTLAGLAKNNADLRRVGGRIGSALTPGAVKVAAVLAGRQ